MVVGVINWGRKFGAVVGLGGIHLLVRRGKALVRRQCKVRKDDFSTKNHPAARLVGKMATETSFKNQTRRVVGQE